MEASVSTTRQFYGWKTQSADVQTDTSCSAASPLNSRVCMQRPGKGE